MCKKVFSTLVLVILAFSASAAFAASTTIVFSSNQWDSQMFHNELAKFIVDNAFDNYEVEYSTGSTNLNWQALINGDVDLDIESWTENIATYKDDVEAGDVVPLRILVPDGRQGIYVPRYVVEGDEERGIEPMAPDLKHVKDIPKYVSLFKDPEDPKKGRIYGSIPGWMIDEVIYNKYKFYGMDKAGYTYFRVGSEAVLFASLDSANNLGDPWIGYCYEPSWIVGKVDLIRLEDEPYKPELFMKGECEIPSQELWIVSSNQFEKRAPDLVPFFKKYQTTSQMVSDALNHMQQTGASHRDTVLWFLGKYNSVLDEWLTPEQAKRVRDAL